MRKHISFAIAAAILGLAMVFCVIGSLAETNTNVARQRADLSSPMSKPYRSVRAFDGLRAIELPKP
jgi:hypothetical protein